MQWAGLATGALPTRRATEGPAKAVCVVWPAAVSSRACSRLREPSMQHCNNRPPCHVPASDTPCLCRRRWGQAQAAAAVEVQAEPAHAGTSSAPEDFRRLFTGKNWDRAWIDGIVRSMTKSERKTNAEECGRVVRGAPL